MSTYYNYAFYMEGRKIAILRERTSDTGETTENIKPTWETPSTDDDEAILFRFTSRVSAPSSITDSINAGVYLNMAIVDYVRSRIAEDSGDDQRAQKYYNRFLRRIGENEDNKLGSSNVCIPTGLGVLA